MNHLNKPIFQDESEARKWLESRVWPSGPVCPHCGVENGSTALKGEAHRDGLHQCNECREQFTVTVGTVFERSKIPLTKWLMVVFLMSSSKKGMSAHQIHRMIGVSYKSTWFMCHRIREAMKPGVDMFSSGGGTIEADATYVGGKEKNKHASKRNPKNIGGVGKQCVFSLVQRDGGVRSFHIPSVNAKTLKPILSAQLNTAETHLMTDGERILRSVSPMFASHQTVNHEAGEYVRGDVHSNTVEGYFSILKRGIVGTFHHVSPQHLLRYTTEFDFRYTYRQSRIKVDGKWVKTGMDDEERANMLLKGIQGRRLTYRTPHSPA